MAATSITTANDSRLDLYRNLKDRELSRLGDRFIAESEFVVRRLLTSRFAVESVLVAARKADDIAQAVPDHVPLFVVAESLLNDIVGYRFHTGVLAVGLRGERRELAATLPVMEAHSTIVICPALNNSENLGSIFRTAAAFGVDAIVLGERCCDPFYRMCVRVSMGTVFRVPIVQSRNLQTDLIRLRTEFGYELAATVLDDSAEPLEQAVRSRRMGIVFGNEAVGLSSGDIEACDRQVTLPMRLGTDSLNVAVSAGIFLYHFTQGGQNGGASG